MDPLRTDPADLTPCNAGGSRAHQNSAASGAPRRREKARSAFCPGAHAPIGGWGFSDARRAPEPGFGAYLRLSGAGWGAESGSAKGTAFINS
jgi:hypothetical protein